MYCLFDDQYTTIKQNEAVVYHRNFYFKWFAESQIVSFMEKNDKWFNSVSHACVYTS